MHAIGIVQLSQLRVCGLWPRTHRGALHDVPVRCMMCIEEALLLAHLGVRQRQP